MRLRDSIITVTLLLVISGTAMFGCGGRPSLANMTADQLYEAGLKHYNEEKYLQSIDYFQAIVFNYPGESVVDTAQYYLALSYLGNEDYKLASVEFNRLIQNYPLSVYASHAQFMTAVCLFEAAPDHYGLDQTDLKEAVEQMEDFVIDYPESELLPEAREYIRQGRMRLAHKLYDAAVLYQRINAHKAAKIYFQEVVDDYTDTEYGPRAVYGIGESDLKLQNYESAHSQFERFANVFPDHELAPEARERMPIAAFKAAEKAFKDGDTAEAGRKFRSFIESYPGDERVEKAREYLEQLPEQTERASASNEQS